MGQFHFDPSSYRELMAREVPAYERLQDEVAAAARGDGVRDVLDLGTGTGETALRVLAVHPGARLIGIDASPGMLGVAREALPAADLRVARLEDPLPPGPFDLVVSALAVHHLDGAGKADLFARVAAVLRDGGRFVLGDVVVPADPADVVTPIAPGYDKPSTLSEQLGWLDAAGLAAEPVWLDRDLAVIRATRR
jgi:tRNA (cmo5U34)-methyltransferase